MHLVVTTNVICLSARHFAPGRNSPAGNLRGTFSTHHPRLRCWRSLAQHGRDKTGAMGVHLLYKKFLHGWLFAKKAVIFERFWDIRMKRSRHFFATTTHHNDSYCTHQVGHVRCGLPWLPSRARSSVLGAFVDPSAYTRARRSLSVAGPHNHKSVPSRFGPRRIHPCCSWVQIKVPGPIWRIQWDRKSHCKQFFPILVTSSSFFWALFTIFSFSLPLLSYNVSRHSL